MLQSSQLLYCRLSIIADIVIGCRAGVVEFCSRISDPSNQKANLFGLHSLSLRARFDATAFPNERLHDRDAHHHILKVQNYVFIGK